MKWALPDPGRARMVPTSSSDDYPKPMPSANLALVLLPPVPNFKCTVSTSSMATVVTGCMPLVCGSCGWMTTFGAYHYCPTRHYVVLLSAEA
jgi:hypothetical protein